MSLKTKKKSVSQIVEKYRGKHPEMDRSTLRKRIRLENLDVFDDKRNKSSASNLRKLDRCLRKEFKTHPPLRPNESSGQPDLEKPYDDLVEKALLKLAEEENRTTMEEVASEVGIPPSNIEPSVYRLIKKYGWKTSKTKLGEVEIDFNKPFDISTVRFG